MSVARIVLDVDVGARFGRRLLHFALLLALFRRPRLACLDPAAGLAAGAAEQLEGAGFTAVTTGNGIAGGGTTSTVFYATADQEVTARQVAATLGITAVVQDADVAGDAVVVLLLRDFAR